MLPSPWSSKHYRFKLYIKWNCIPPTGPCSHPRMRGEHRSGICIYASYIGSSPHARGAQGGQPVGDGGHRIIPACAGSTPRPNAPSYRRRDHPRMRGEHGEAEGERALILGSSPHARGALVCIAKIVVPPRIIPACAGSTGMSMVKLGNVWDHPRMRGEHTRE